MLLNLLTGIPVMLICLLFQAIFVGISLRQYIRFRRRHEVLDKPLWQIALLALVMLLAMLGNFLQMVAWAGLFVLVGEFSDFSTALYHSGVNFATLGYGDIVMSERWRLLGALEAANGILMFGVSTSMMTAALTDLIRHGRPSPSDEP
ncbi:potassium channel family protein [Azotobacter beijerinckii]|uniref:Ion channel n=1 Tax=Azotobacter beijerinckii TaxID=170623 RepID=A0A1I4CI77_9GAMM|nr:potassium channel family protein [Azotobacter beijerinckii]SFB37829.1 Ion channel [Azotobacter beijerinckii]SFK80655.1 Ion channel [Azotobacter beijerinckii]